MDYDEDLLFQVPPMALQSEDEMELVEESTLKRSHLEDEMDPECYETIVEETQLLINRRFTSMQEFTRVSAVNLNPFLMLAMAPAYNIYSPFEAAEYLQNAKMPHGDATAFGKFVEAKIFPLFGTSNPPEKIAQKDMFSPIDAEVTVDGNRYLTSWKSGPWTMNQTHANEMVRRFPEIHKQTQNQLILGIFYGRVDQLNNKPALVRTKIGSYLHILVGADLWEFITGVKQAHMKVLDAIREAQDRFAIEHGGKTFYEHMIEARLSLTESIRRTYGFDGTEDDMWEKIFLKAF